jgi:NAD(P)H-dependent FMN reductase
LNEPNHPRLQKYVHDYTKAWSARVAAADAFVFVLPEYNFAPPPAFVNAIDYLYVEWHYKAAGFVTYGGISAGTRSFLGARQMASTVKMVPLTEAVHIPFVAQQVSDGVFAANASQDKAAAVMLAELLRWTGALSALRLPKP